jgi:hypothetical protein
MFVEGGWGSWAILIFGMVTLGASIRFAVKPDRAQLPFLAAIALTTLISAVNACWSNVAVVFSVLEDPAKVADSELVRILFVGLKESSRPGTLAGIVLTLACLLVSIGFLREKRPASAER